MHSRIHAEGSTYPSYDFKSTDRKRVIIIAFIVDGGRTRRSTSERKRKRPGFSSCTQTRMKLSRDTTRERHSRSYAERIEPVTTAWNRHITSSDTFFYLIRCLIISLRSLRLNGTRRRRRLNLGHFRTLKKAKGNDLTASPCERSCAKNKPDANALRARGPPTWRENPNG